MVRAGQLTELAIFERQTPEVAIDDSGGEWQPLFEAWVGLKPISAREIINSQQVEGQATHLIETHWQAGVLTSDRMKLAKEPPVLPDEPENDANFRIFHFQSIINPNEQNRTLQLLAVEKI